MRTLSLFRAFPLLLLSPPVAVRLQAQAPIAAAYTRLAVVNADSAALVLQHFASSSSSEDLVNAVYYASAAVTYFALAPKSSDSTLVRIRSAVRRLSGEMGVQLVDALRANGSLPPNDVPGLLTWASILRDMTTRARTKVR